MPTDDDQLPGDGRRKQDNGPSFGAYVETRFNLLVERIEAAQAATDIRYQQRFEAQSAALNAAFLSQQAATQTAFTVAEKAVQAALTAADRAVSKAETASEKRFEGLDLMNRRMDALEGRLVGVGQSGKSMKENVSLAFSAVVLLVLLWRAVTGQ